MKKLDFGQAVTLLANLGVIAGIVFLAIELRQNNDQLSAQSRAERVAIYIDWLNGQYLNEEFAELIVRASNNDPLTDVDEYRLRQFNQRQFVALQYVYGEFQRGMIDESEISAEAWRFGFREIPLALDSWNEAKIGFNEDFVEFMERYVVTEP